MKGVNKKSRNLQGELKDVQRLLKFNPGNTELLKQKQKLLGEEVENTADKLKQLKRAEKQVQQQFEKGEIGEGQYRAFRREIEQTESKLEHFEDQLKETKQQARKFGHSLQKAGDKMKGFGKGMQQAGGVAAGATAGLIAGLFGVVEGTEEFRTSLSKLEQNAKNAGISTDTIKDSLVDLSAVSNETDSNVEALSNLLASGFDKQGLKAALDALSGAVVKFPDTLKIEGLSDGLQETIATGKPMGQFAELLGRVGVNTDRWAEKLKKAKEEGKAQELVLETLANTGLSKVNEKYRKNNQELVKSKESSAQFRQAMAKLGETLTPIVTALTKVITGLVNWFNKLGPTGRIIVLVIGAIVAAMAILLPIIGSAIIIIGSMTTAVGALEIAMGPLILIILAVMAAIAALIAIGVLLYKNWDTIMAYAKKNFSGIYRVISKFLHMAWEVIKTIWGYIKGTFKNALKFVKSLVTGDFKGMKEAASDQLRLLWKTIKDIWGSIKEFFKSIDLLEIGKNLIGDLIDGFTSLNIPTPHFNVVGSLDLNPAGGFHFPSLDVNWYKKGGVFSDPSIVGVGDASTPEVVAPEKMLRNVFEDVLKNFGGGGPSEVTIQIPLDGKVISEKTYKFDMKNMQDELDERERGG